MTPERLAEIERLTRPPHRGRGGLERNSALRELLAEIRRLRSGPDWAEFRRLKQLVEASARAIEALERIQESARDRIAALEDALCEACCYIASDVTLNGVSVHDRLRAMVGVESKP